MPEVEFETRKYNLEIIVPKNATDENMEKFVLHILGKHSVPVKKLERRKEE